MEALPSSGDYMCCNRIKSVDLNYSNHCCADANKVFVVEENFD